ncbi:YqaA family protein [Acinetobacter baumannii]|uniref:YqaA family protein n=1 Tax=Acinetobacter TaxID=469 RepID=UPI00046DEAB2|nr:MULTISPECIES: YqaA family protein [Acinetobacter calcoaceticus/baumannii complex]NUF62403.1 DedA family protein [Acinetobacter bereziniae]PVA05056.1 DedA family protein [Acinetobacter nosocomialis]AUT32844.1 DedA family protein [Acinetobacter pittii]MCF4467920.1 DedA family protein [Acinetobacter baumannii]MCF4505773.1 DedA family protein [Acinetobacter baumannii]
MMAYVLLFLSAFGAATLLPLQSETVLAGLFLLGRHSELLLILVATVGNVLGSCVNWWLGIQLEAYKDKRWFPVSEKHLLKAQTLYAKYGSPILLISWVPVIGDPITLVSGVLKEKFTTFIILVFTAKFLRYIVVYMIYLEIA